MMDSCDVLVVGAGPAGSSLAWGLRNSGLGVIVMDKQTFPRNKTCAGWITPTVIKTLQLDMDHYAREHTLQPVHGFRIGRIGDDTIDVCYGSDPVSYGIRRCEFDYYLLQRCKATLLTGEPFKHLQRKNNTWIVNNHIQARLVVGAGGHFCPVARHLGARIGRAETAVTAQEIEFKPNAGQMNSCNVDAAMPELYFCPDLKGYGWILKKGDYLNIGLGREDKHKLSEHVAAFCEFLKARQKNHFDIPNRFDGHAYLLYQHSTRVKLADGILLIGDAAGLAYTQSGEGIRPAIESGLVADEIIRKANGDYRIENLSGYVDAITHLFGRQKPKYHNLPKLPDKLRQLLAQKLLKSHWFARNIVINRWFLHHDLPPLYSF